MMTIMDVTNLKSNKKMLFCCIILLSYPNHHKVYNMRKSDLVNIIAEKTGIPKVDVFMTVETFLKEIKQNVVDGNNIYIRGFGSFQPKKRAAKIGRNIKRNTIVKIQEHYIPAFKPSDEFIDMVKENYKPKI